MQNTFKWLQFSDLHLSIESFDTEFLKERLISFLTQQNFSCDYIFITGDVANKGDYSNTEIFVRDRLIKAINIKNKENIYWCIGNHDIKRDSKIRKDIITRIRCATDPYIAFESAMKDEEERDIITSSGVKGYLDAHKRILGRELSRENVFDAHTYHDLGMCNLVMLNTSLTYCDENDEGRLMILEKRLLETMCKVNDVNKPFIVIGHHGKDFLYSKGRNDHKFERMLDSARVDLYLCGHSHNLGYDCFVNASYDIHQVTCGGGNASDGHSVFSFILGEYNGDKHIVNFTPYSYSDRSGTFDTDYASHPRLTEANTFELKRLIDLNKQSYRSSDYTDMFYARLGKYHEDNNRVRLVREITGLTDRDKKIFETMLKMDKEEDPITFLDALYRLSHNLSGKTLMIYGDGGSGKTFMLIKGLYDIHSSSGRHVLYIPLNKLSFRTNRSDERPIEDYIQTYVFNSYVLSNWKQHYNSADGEEIVLLLDGFNEVSSIGNRSEAISSELEELSGYLNCRIIIASRYENMLASRIRFGNKAKITELTNENVRDYLHLVRPKLSIALRAEKGLKTVSDETAEINERSPLFTLLKNPLILNLYGQITLGLDKDNDKFINDRKMCGWIELDTQRNVRISYVLWNYLNREVLKEEIVKDKFLAWLCVNVFWPKVAFYIQSNDSFDISERDLDIQVTECITWVRNNIDIHPSLKRIKNEANSTHYNMMDFDDFLEEINVRKIREYMQLRQAFFAKQDDNYTFLHQSIRDCLAAMHLLNVITSEIELFPRDWARKDIFKNPYVFDHFMNLAGLNNYGVIRKAVELLRDKEITEDSYLMENLLLAMRRPELFNGDLINFNFAGLDLFNCDLTEVKLNQGDLEANLSEARRIGSNTFIKPSHNKIVQNIAVSKDGNLVLSCGDDKVLLWRFNDRKVEKVIHNYSIGAKNNRCCFSANEQKILFSDDNVLMVYNLCTDKIERRIRAGGKIYFLSSVIESEKCYYIITDVYGTSSVWLDDNGIIDQENVASLPTYILYSRRGQWIRHTHMYGKLIRLQSNSSTVELIDKDGRIIKLYSLETIARPDKVAFAEKGNLCALSYKLNNNISKIVILDLSSSTNKIVAELLTQLDIGALTFASSGKWLGVFGRKDNSFCLHIYEQKQAELGYSALSEKILLDVRYTSPVFYESIIFYGTHDGKIIVDEIAQGDNRYYVYTRLDNHPPYVNNFSIIPNTGRCVAAYEDGVLREWDYKNGLILHTFERKHDGPINCVAVASDKKLFASGGADGKIILWDREDSQPFLKIVGDVSNRYLDTFEVGMHRITSLSFACEDRYVIAGTIAGGIYVWDIEYVNKEDDVETLKPIIVFEKLPKPVGVFMYKIDDEERILAEDNGGNIFFGRVDFEEKKIEEIKYYRNQNGNRIHGTCISSSTPFGHCIVTYGADGVIKLWNANTGESIKELWKSANWGSVCFSSDGNKLYFTYSNYDSGRLDLMEMDLCSPDYAVKHIHNFHEIGSRRNVKAFEDVVLTSANDGFIQVCDCDGNNIHRLEVPRTNIDKFAAFHNYEIMVKLEINFSTPGQFLYIQESPIKGEFTKLLLEGKIINIFKFIDMDSENLTSSKYCDLFGPTFNESVNDLERIRLLASSIIACTMERQPEVLEWEYELLETLLIYINYEASIEEQNVPMLIEILSGEQSAELPLFNLLKNRATNKENRSVHLNRLIGYYFYTDDTTKCLTANSLLGRLRPFFRIYSEILPIVPEEQIHSLAMSTVMNFSINWFCPSSFNDIAKAQVLFIEMIWHYLNTLSDEERKRKKLFNLLSAEINDFLRIVENLPNIEKHKCVKKLLGKFNKAIKHANYINLSIANNRITDFYREI